jgi:catechol 2,3-dioxygenase-like lactoylglutathione lyase family enzyme
MIDHAGFAVADIERSKRFYEAALAPLGLTLVMDIPPEQNAQGGGGRALGFGSADNPFFWVADNQRVGEGTHVAFRVESRALVDAFYEAAIAAGGQDNGGPGIRAQYHPNYYAAFVFDPDGFNIEAVCHAAQ